ncbi:Ribosomal protein L36e [Arabidopsis suecica]|uniref:60S ribosomal protein L36 n=1 Tax=Arabidopsis suecica TaxID=45249 RepID=A0A8T1ZCB9_ARASU|nr:Ribosomal protein L36e [Arabidopsis suecica]
MTTLQVKTGLFVGLNKGHVVTRRELAPRPRSRKGKTSKRTILIRNLSKEVAGMAPYEKRITELLKVGNGKDKRALKVAKRKLGTHKIAKRKKERRCPVIADFWDSVYLHAGLVVVVQLRRRSEHHLKFGIAH